MIRAVLFDMGGTLDGDAQHWLDRFARLYADAGVDLARERVRAAFDAAERRAATDEPIATTNLESMLARHVGWQLEELGIEDPQLQRRIADRFVSDVRSYAAKNAALLAGLRDRGLALGVVSNGCGNVDILCDDLGYARHLSTIVDSRRVGLYKPDPAIFIYAAARLGVPASQTLMVGDSFDRDVRPAKSAGMMTAWLEGTMPRECPDPSLADIRLRRLADLPGALETIAVAVGAPRS